MKLSKLYYSNTKISNSISKDKDIFELPIDIKNRIHYLSTHVKKIYNSDKAAKYKKYVENFEKLAEYYSYDIYIDDESLPNIGVIRLVSEKILLHDEFIHDISANLLSMLNGADEVVIDNYIGCDRLVTLTIKYYLFDIVM